MLQIGEALFYYKLGQTLLQIGAASSLQIRASVVTNWGSYYKLGQLLSQNRAATTNWGKMYYKLGKVLQIRTIITNWAITNVMNSYIAIYNHLLVPICCSHLNMLVTERKYNHKTLREKCQTLKIWKKE